MTARAFAPGTAAPDVSSSQAAERFEEAGTAGLFWRLLLLTVALQAGLLLFEQREQIAYWLTRPFMQADYGYHYYFSVRQAESALMGRGFTGYDPQMFAGMDIWPQVTPSDRLTVLLMTLTPKAWWPAVFNLQYLAMFLAMPALFLAAAWRFGAPGKALSYAIPVGLVLFWLTLPSFLGRGIVTFVFSLFLALWLAAEIRYLTFSFSHLRAAVVALGTAALVFIHPAGAFVIAFLALTVLIARRKHVDRRILAWVGVTILLTFAFNWPWARVLPWFKYSASSTASSLTFSSLAHFWQYHYGDPGISGLRIFLPMILVLATLPFVIRDETYKKRAMLTATWALFFTALYVFGSFMPLVKLMQPQRFNVGVKVMGALYGVVLLSYLLAKVRLATLKHLATVVPTFCATILLCGWAGAKANLGDTYATHPMNDVAQMLRRHTPEGSRILLIRGPHDPVKAPEVDEQCVLGSYLNREWLGTEWIVPTLAKFGHENIGTHDDLVSGTATKGEWESFRDRNRVEYVAFPTQNRRQYSSWANGLTELGEAGGYALFASGGPSSRFLKGKGEVQARLNEFTLKDVTAASDGSVVIAYHLSPGHKLVGAPGAALKRQHAPGDAYGFIEVADPPETFQIVFDPEMARRAAK